MRRAFAVLATLLGLLLAGPALADAPVWALRGEHNTVYLAGSVHLQKRADAGLPANLRRAYASAGSVVLELDLDDLDPTAAQSWVLQHGVLDDGRHLRDVVGADVYARTGAAADSIGVPVAMLDRFEPWTAALTLVQLRYAALGYDPDAGIDQQIEAVAQRDGKPVRGLETLDEQLGALDGLSYADQSRFLAMTVDELDTMDEETDQLLAAWRAGDSRELARILGEEYERFPQLYRALVTDRNRRWMDRIAPLLHEERDVLIVVGALHLVGRDGLLELARSRGWQPREVH